jgi:MFS transporter, DHA2 family, multidrug resistance protein
MSLYRSMTGSVNASAGDQAHIVVQNRTALTIAIMVATIMQVLDTTIANVALPHMEASLGATQDTVSWILTSYILASAVIVPLSGWLAGRYGTRTLLLFSLILFVGASALCGLATSLFQMVIFRFLQGLGGAFIAPLAQTFMLDINRPSEHAKAMAVYGMAIMIGPIVGPMLGGFITENLDWRWVFFVNVPIGVLCIAALWVLLPRAPRQHRRMDLFGWGLTALGIGTLQLMLDRGQTVDWFGAREIWIYAGISISAFWMLAVHTATTPHPLFPLVLLGNRNLMSGVIFMFITAMVMMASMALLPSMLQGIYNYPVVDAGILMTSRGIGVVVAMGLSGRLLAYVDARLLLGIGFATAAISLWMMTGWSLEMSSGPIIESGFVQGIGLGLVFVPLNFISFSTLPPTLRTEGTALMNLARNIGASVGIAIVTVLLARNIQISHADIASKMTSYNLPMDPGQLRGYGSFGDMAISIINGIVTKQAVMIAYLDDFKFMMIISLCTLPLLLLLRKPPKRKGAEEPMAMME